MDCVFRGEMRVGVFGCSREVLDAFAGGCCLFVCQDSFFVSLSLECSSVALSKQCSIVSCRIVSRK